MKKRQKMLFYIGTVLLLTVPVVFLTFGFEKVDRWRIETSEKLLVESQNNHDVKKSFYILQKAALLDPTEKTYLLTGEKAQVAGYDRLAAYYFRKIKTADGYYELGNIYYESVQYKNAELAYIKSLNKEINQKALLGLGKVYLKKGDIEKAKNFFGQALSLNKDDKETVYFADLSGLVSDSKVITEINNINPKKIELEEIAHSPTLSTRINLLYQYLKSSDYPQLAYNFLQDKDKGKQLDRDGYLLLADEYYSRKDYDKSYQYLLSAKSIDQYYPQTYQHLADVAEFLNKKDEANQYREYLKTITW
ncbi:MAG: tetratricopeptide repeat protein [Patescibacteria group bacterium]